MIELTLLQTVTLIVMLYEIAKIPFYSTLWSNIKGHWFSTNKSENVIEKKYKKNPVMTYISGIYMFFLAVLTFSQWWYVGLSLLVLSIIGALVLFPIMKANEPFSSKIFIVMLLDTIFTLLLLSYVINPLELFQ